jgi:hypothetical protein
MRVMWELGNAGRSQQPPGSTTPAGAFSSFAAACGCDQSGPGARVRVGWLRALADTYGYYPVDNGMLAPGDRTGVARNIAKISNTTRPTVMIGSGQPSATGVYQPVADVIGAMIYQITGRRNQAHPKPHFGAPVVDSTRCPSERTLSRRCPLLRDCGSQPPTLHPKARWGALRPASASGGVDCTQRRPSGRRSIEIVSYTQRAT